MSLSFDKLTTGTYSFVSVILNSNPVGATIAGLSSKTQFFDEVKTNSISQLISDIFILFQKLLKCFSGITTLVSLHQLYLHHNLLYYHQYY